MLKFTIDATEEKRAEQPENLFAGRYAVLFGDNMVRRGDQQTNGFHQLLMGQLGLRTCPYSGSSGATFEKTVGHIYAGTGQESLVLVLAGLGDLENNLPLGTYGDRSFATIRGSVYRMCLALLEKYPRADHLVITPACQTRYVHSGGVTGADLARSIVRICGSFGIPVYDYYRFSGICGETLELLTHDGCHWNQQAQNRAARDIGRFLGENFRAGLIPGPGAAEA